MVKVDKDGDLRVDFDGLQFVYAPACCLRVDQGTVDTLSSTASGGDPVSEIRNVADDKEGGS